MNYWQECISEALDEAGIEASQEQIQTIAKIVSGAHENYGMAFGHDCIPNPVLAEVETLKKKIKKIEEGHEKQIFGIRKGVAERRGIDVSNVYVDDNGNVTYDRR